MPYAVFTCDKCGSHGEDAIACVHRNAGELLFPKLRSNDVLQPGMAPAECLSLTCRYCGHQWVQPTTEALKEAGTKC